MAGKKRRRTTLEERRSMRNMPPDPWRKYMRRMPRKRERPAGTLFVSRILRRYYHDAPGVSETSYRAPSLPGRHFVPAAEAKGISTFRPPAAE